jgi:ATP-binding cassette, subfamily B, vacuolar membrane transporter HMT1/ACLQ
LLTYEAVHLNSAVDLELAKLEASIMQYQSGEFAVLASLNGLNAMQTIIFSLGLIAVLLISSYRITQDAESIADFVTVTTYMIQLKEPLGFLGSVYNMVQNSLVDAENMLNLVVP